MADDSSLLSQTGIVVVAAGSGRRFGALKQFALVAGKPLLAHCLTAFDQIEVADRIVVLPYGGERDATWTEIARTLRHPVRVVTGGAERADSVRAGIEALSSACEYAAVHDGARPLVRAEWITACLKQLAADPQLAAVIVARLATDTLKQLAPGSPAIERTIDRSRIARAETPQVCRRHALLAALLGSAASSSLVPRPSSLPFTDEAHALEAAGRRTSVLLIDEPNIKVTLPEDVALAEALLAARKD